MDGKYFNELLDKGSQEQTIDPSFKEEVENALRGSIEYDNHVAFWGSCFSNFFPTRFYLDGRFWTSSEKYFMFQKAMTFGDEEIAQKILFTDTPKECKNLGRQVKNFISSEWDKVKEEIMYKAVKAKFEQDGLCRHCLLFYSNKHFVEGSPVDKIWGVGVSYTDRKIDNEKNWKGENLLGKILDKVRDEAFEDMYE